MIADWIHIFKVNYSMDAFAKGAISTCCGKFFAKELPPDFGPVPAPAGLGASPLRRIRRFFRWGAGFAPVKAFDKAPGLGYNSYVSV